MCFYIVNLEEYHTGVLRHSSAVIEVGVTEMQFFLMFGFTLVFYTDGKFPDWTVKDAASYFYPDLSQN